MISRENSSYSPMQDRSRLINQANGIQIFDHRILQSIFPEITSKNRRILQVLDVGCADAYLTYSLFSYYPKLNVLGLDKSSDAVQQAQNNFGGSNFTFKCFDIENDSLEGRKYDLIFCSYLVPHLKCPQSAIQKLWDSLAIGGVLFLRAGDDGWKLTHSNTKALEKLLSQTMIGRRASDRHAGRKIYSYLKNLTPQPTYTNVVIDAETTANMNSEERVDFFDKYYSFRADYVQREIVENGPSHELEILQKELIESIKIERERFRSDNNLFSVNFHIAGIARKGEKA